MKEIRTCPVCGKQLGKKNMSGFCNKHRNRTGKNNPMYGKSITNNMTPEKIAIWKENISKASKEHWKDLEYRNKVIGSITGLKRSEGFKKGQSERTKQSYINNPDLRKQRGKLFSECWQDGRNHFHAKLSTNRSIGEKELFSELEKIDGFKVERKTIKAINDKWYFPDILVNDKFIIEFYGDYYHANPNIYSDDILIRKKNLTAKQVREEDKKRKFVLESAGYNFLVIWQSEWKQNKEKCISKIIEFINSNSGE